MSGSGDDTSSTDFFSQAPPTARSLFSDTENQRRTRSSSGPADQESVGLNSMPSESAAIPAQAYQMYLQGAAGSASANAVTQFLAALPQAAVGSGSAAGFTQLLGALGQGGIPSSPGSGYPQFVGLQQPLQVPLTFVQGLPLGTVTYGSGTSFVTAAPGSGSQFAPGVDSGSGGGSRTGSGGTGSVGRGSSSDAANEGQASRTPLVPGNFAKVLDCLDRFAADMIKPLDPKYRSVHPRLQQRRFHPYFNNCIGAIDGTHVNCIVGTDKVVQYMNRKGNTSQNVLAVCDFDMRFTFALAGWPGSVHDMRVLKDAQSNHAYKFPAPPKGKFYLVDSGYPNRPGYLAPYRGNRYHIPEFRTGRMPRGVQETFNYAHSSLRNVVERSFAVLKEKWRILKLIPRYPVRKQSQIIFACMGLHNFILQNDAEDEDVMKFQGEDDVPQHGADEDSSSGADECIEDDEGDNDMNRFRDELAHGLFYRD